MQSVIGKNEKKSSRLGRFLLFVASIGLGGIGVYFANEYIRAEVNGIRAQFETTEPMVDVVVPANNMLRGDTVESAYMSVRKIPAQYVDSNSVTASTFSQAEGQRLDFDIDAGTALLWAHLEGGTTPTFSGKVPSGMRALTVHVDEINSVSGFLQPKDRIDLLFTHGDGDKQKTRPLIQNLSVIATGMQTMVDKASYGAQRVFSTITVQVNPIDAKKITLAQQIGSLTAVLRNPEDSDPTQTEAITIASLLGEPIVKKPKRIKTHAVKPIEKEPSIQFIIGGQRQ